MAGSALGERATQVWVGDEEIAVLHVDDEPDLVETAAALLERQDERLDVEPETDPSAVLERIGTTDYDCIVSDFDMPGIDGLELLGRVREDRPSLPFILYTGKGSEEIASEAISAGVTDYLQKATGTDQYEVLANRVTNAVTAWRARRQVERDQRAMAAAWDGIGTLDEDGQFTYVNRAYAETFGYEPDALVGRPWTSVYPDGETRTVAEEILPAVLDHGIWTGDTRLQRADGEIFVGEHTVALLHEGSGMVCVVRDRSERDALEQTLRHERERYRLLVESVDEYAIFVLDPDGTVRTWNAGAERIKGYTADDIVGQHFSTFYPEAARHAGLPERLLQQARADGSVQDEGKRVRADGSTFWADVTITALYEKGTLRGFAKVTKDVSAEKERERQRERSATYRRRLFELSTDPDRAIDAKLTDVLALGAEYLGVEHGHIVTIDPESDLHRVVAVSGDHPDIAPGGESSLGETYCRRTIDTDEILTVYNAPEQGWADDPAYEAYGLGCYVGARIDVDGRLFGTTCFVDRDPRRPFHHEERDFVRLLSRWLTDVLTRHEEDIQWPVVPT